jgi:hypothetical protein
MYSVLDGGGSIAGRFKRFFSTPQRRDRLWVPPILLSSGYWGLFPGGKATKTWSWPPASSWRRGEDWWSCTSSPPYGFMAWCLIKRRDNLTVPFTSYNISSSEVFSPPGAIVGDRESKNREASITVWFTCRTVEALSSRSTADICCSSARAVQPADGLLSKLQDTGERQSLVRTDGTRRRRFSQTGGGQTIIWPGGGGPSQASGHVPRCC